MENRKEYLLLLILFVLCLCGKCQKVESVRDYINTTDLKAKEIVLKQSILETGWYKSYSCRERHNLFGFRYKGKYLVFDKWQDSVDYYVRWQKRHYKEGDYYKFLEDRGYAEDKEYIRKLQMINLK